MDLRSPNRYSPAFVQAAQQAGYPLNHDFNGCHARGRGHVSGDAQNGERYSAAKAYLTPNLGRPNLQVMTDAQVTRVLMQGKRATAWSCAKGSSCASC